MNRSVRTLIIMSLLAAPVASAQEYGAEGAFVDDGNVGQETRHGRGRRPGEATSIEEARSNRSSLTLGDGYYRRAIPETYTVRRGDTLWDVTGHHYGNPWEWPRVWSYNPEITNPHWIYPLDTIRLLPAGQTDASLPTTRSQRITRRSDGADAEVYLRDEGFLENDLMRASGVIVGSPNGHMMLTPYEEVYVRFDDPSAVEVGREYTIFHEFDTAARGNNERGLLVRVFGAIRVLAFDRQRGMARGVITEALDPIERGFRVAPMTRRFSTVPARRNERDIEGSIIAALRPVHIFGDQQILFLDIGANQHVQEGNRAFVIRRGDEWTDSNSVSAVDMGGIVPSAPADRTRLPDEVLAEVRIVQVRRDTSVGLVTRAVHEVEIGDKVELRSGY